MAAALVTAGTPPAEAAWPERPVRIVIPFAPGGTADILARMVQKSATTNHLLPQPIVVTNVGGHFSVGTRQVMDARPDGYTFLLIHLALISGKASGTIDFGHREFAPVAATGELCQLVAVKEGGRYASLSDLLKAAQQKPDTITFGVNIGALNHMAGITLQNAAPGARFRFVQTGGGAANYNALAGGHIEATVFSGAEYLNFRQGGVRGLAFMAPARDSFVPDLPTAREAGYDAAFCFQFFWFAPKGTPAEAIDGFASMLRKAMATRDVQTFLTEQAMAPRVVAGADYARLLDEVDAAITPIAKQAR